MVKMIKEEMKEVRFYGHVKFVNCLIFLFAIIILSSLVLAEVAVDTNLYLFGSSPSKSKSISSNDYSSVDLFSGGFTYGYSLDVPPGTNELSPEVSLFYNSHNLKKAPGIAGSGWTLSESYIQRVANYSFGKTNDDSFRLILNGVEYDLIYSNNDKRHHTETEKFYFIGNFSGGQNEKGQYWVVKTKDGKNYRFGFYNASEVIAKDYGYTFRWYLDLVNDSYGNSIFYSYVENFSVNDRGSVYLTNITYNNDKKRKINFIFEPINRPDFWISYSEGNKISQSRRLKSVEVIANGSLVKKYALEYRSLENVKSQSFIANITEFGSDGVSFLPSVKFNYNSPRVNWTEDNAWKIPGCYNNLNYEMCFVTPNFKDNGVRLEDVNRDGLLDIIRASGNKDGANSYSKTWINNGTGWKEDPTWKIQGCYNNLNYEACFTTPTLNDNGVRLADVNGDGLVDLIRANGYKDLSYFKPYVKIWINNGTGWKEDPTWKIPGCYNNLNYEECFLTSSSKDNGVRLADVNGDNFVDIIRASGNKDGANSYSKTWINNGTGWKEDPTWKIQDCYNNLNYEMCFVTPNFKDNGVRLIDVNGDNLPDLVRASGFKDVFYSKPYVKTLINNGSGWNEDPTWKIPYCLNDLNYEMCFTTPGIRDNGVRLADLNGDGLPDLIRANANEEYSYQKVLINNGTGWTVDSAWKLNGPPLGTEPSCFNNLNYEACFVRPTYFNNNGVILADVNGDNLPDLVRASGDQEMSYAKTWINNGKGSYLINNITTQFGGGVSINYFKSTLLNNKGNDSVGDLGFNLWLVSNISEDNGMGGSQNVKVVKSYNYSGGLYEYKDKEFRGFNLVQEGISNKLIKHLFHQDNARKGLEYQNEVLDNQSNPYRRMEKIWNITAKNNYNIVELIEESELSYDGTINNPKIKNVSYDYDDFGNIIFIFHKGDVADSVDNKYEYFSYLNNSNLWIVDKVKNYSLYNSSNSGKMRVIFYSYDNLAYGQVPTKGSLTKREDWLNTGGNPITIYGYNSFGNLINETDSNNRTTKYLYGLRDTTNTFIDRIINSKGHLVDYWYDLGTGNLLSEMDANKIATNYTYDVFGRKTKEILPYDNSTYPTTVYEYSMDGVAPEKIKIAKREKNLTANTLDEYTFYDGFGRYIQTKKEGDNLKLIVEDIYYDNEGRLQKQSNPYFISFNDNYTLSNQTINFTLYSYDQLDRVIKLINPDGTFRNITYNHWNITIYDENNHRKDYQINAFNKIIGVTEHFNGSLYLTKYTYDAADLLISIRDSKGNSFNYAYDSLGRKISMSDPDIGLWNYSYDSVGNLIKQIDGKNNTIIIQYDQLNRKVKEIGTSLNRSYFYDIKLNNTLSRVEIGNVIINYTYDNRLRRIKEDKLIDNLLFTSQWTYDSLNRIESVILPDKKRAVYLYNNQGLLSSVADISNISYNEKGLTISRKYTSLIISNYSYKIDNFRLTKIKTDTKQDISYNYDNVGNVKLINDTANSKVYSMGYDDLDRLSGTKIVDNANQKNYTLNFTYDQLGNILQVLVNTTNYTYSYGQKPVHAPSKILQLP